MPHLCVSHISGQSRSWLTHHYYSLQNSRVTYASALQASAGTSFAGVQGHLWAPSSYLEIESVVLKVFSVDQVWYAYSDSASEGTWLVTAGPDIGADMSAIIPWEGSEPNGRTGENCAIFWHKQYTALDIGCDATYKYIIEYECPFGQRFNDQGTACIGMCLSYVFHGSPSRT